MSWKESQQKKLLQGVENYCRFVALKNNKDFCFDVEIDWEHISKAYKLGSANDCKVQWFSYLYPKSSLVFSNQDYEGMGCDSWLELAKEIKRTPFFAFFGFKNKKNTKWQKEEDEKLLRGVELYGQCWMEVSKVVETKSQRQCLQRFKSIDPCIRRGRFSEDEDKALKEAALVFSSFSDMAKNVVGRTDVQCRERLSYFKKSPCSWTSDELNLLRNLVQKYGRKWSLISKLMPSRTNRELYKMYEKIK